MLLDSSREIWSIHSHCTSRTVIQMRQSSIHEIKPKVVAVVSSTVVGTQRNPVIIQQ